MIIDVTNSPKDWEDFWYNSEDILEGQSNNILVLNYTSIHNKHWEDYKCGKYYTEWSISCSSLSLGGCYLFY